MGDPGSRAQPCGIVVAFCSAFTGTSAACVNAPEALRHKPTVGGSPIPLAWPNEAVAPDPLSMAAFDAGSARCGKGLCGTAPVGGEKSYPMHWRGGASFVCAWCYRRITNGDEDNMWLKYEAIKNQTWKNPNAHQIGTTNGSQWGLEPCWRPRWLVVPVLLLLTAADSFMVQALCRG